MVSGSTAELTFCMLQCLNSYTIFSIPARPGYCTLFRSDRILVLIFMVYLLQIFVSIKPVRFTHKVSFFPAGVISSLSLILQNFECANLSASMQCFSIDTFYFRTLSETKVFINMQRFQRIERCTFFLPSLCFIPSQL